MATRRNPAVVAGLAGALALVPQAASALSLQEALDAIDGAFASPSVAFAAGVAGGVVLTGAICGTAALVRSRRSRVAEPEAEDAPEPYRPKHMRAEEPPAQVLPEPAERRRGPSHAASDYEDIASNYVKRASFRARMARRAEGVAAILRERMDASMMEGVPVIERADGSVGDVGTSWWQDAVGASHEGAQAAHELAVDYAIPSDFSLSDADHLAAAARRQGSISGRVAFVDEGAFPEHRTADDLSSADDWEAALRSLDERISEEAPVTEVVTFLDTVGGADTLDEPDGLELSTSFIPFKTPAGHPEVVDTETYVDYLIRDEFSKNSSTAVRRSSRRFLRVLEGGTQPSSRHLADTEASQPLYAGKHFSVPQAAEA